jgi:hypothetical protein
MMRIAPAWAKRVGDLLDARQPIDETTHYTPAIQFIVTRLAKSGRAFRIHQLGAGVKRITTDTDTCPCCKKKLICEA